MNRSDGDAAHRERTGCAERHPLPIASVPASTSRMRSATAWQLRPAKPLLLHPGSNGTTVLGETGVRRSWRFLALSSALVGAVPSPASADSRTATFRVMIRILPSCTVSTGDLKWGSVSGAAQDQAGIAVDCSENRPWSVSLSEGLAAGSATTRRALASSGDAVDYAVHAETSDSIVWADQAISGSGPGLIIPVAGRLPVDQLPRSRIDGDTIAVTVTY